MIALHIVIDGGASIVAGAEELQVLVLALGCNLQADLTNPSRERRGVAPQPVYDLIVTGMARGAGGTLGQAAHWLDGLALQVGQTVTITVIDTLRADPALPGRVVAPRGRTEREHFEHCKRTYLALKDKYDHSPTVPRLP